MTTGERIRSRRLELGMTQEELARKLGYKTKSTLSAIESGRNELKQAKIKQFATALDCDPLWLIGISSDLRQAGNQTRIARRRQNSCVSIRNIAYYSTC